jgi:hypothetical protein
MKIKDKTVYVYNYNVKDKNLTMKDINDLVSVLHNDKMFLYFHCISVINE